MVWCRGLILVKPRWSPGPARGGRTLTVVQKHCKNQISKPSAPSSVPSNQYAAPGTLHAVRRTRCQAGLSGHAFSVIALRLSGKSYQLFCTGCDLPVIAGSLHVSGTTIQIHGNLNFATQSDTQLVDLNEVITGPLMNWKKAPPGVHRGRSHLMRAK